MPTIRTATIARAVAASSLALAFAVSLAFVVVPVSARAASPPHLGVRAAILVSPSTGQQLFGVNATRQVPVASTTKLMTALIVLEHEKRLGRMFTMPNYRSAPTDSQIGLAPGEHMSVHDLMLALLLPSADDAAEDLAYNVGHGSVSRFIAMMNRRARQLGLRHTHYSTPIGLDTPGNYSSASDLVKLAAYVLRTEPFFARAVAAPRAVLRTGSHVRLIANRNDLVGKVPWINGVKTGHTNGAGYVLVASARKDRMTLLSAVLGTSSEAARDDNTLALLKYGYANFTVRTPIRAGTVLGRPPIKDQSGKYAVVVAGRSLTRVIARSERVHVRLRLPRQLAGPLRRHTVVGTAVVFAGTRQIARVPLVLAHPVPAVSPLTRAARFITRPSTLVSLAVLLVAAIALAVLRTRGPRKREVEPA